MSDLKWQAAAPLFLVGVGVGAALGVLFAPKSGDETRGDISGAINDGLDGIAQQGNRLNRRAQAAIDTLRGQVRDVAEAGEQAFRDAKNAATTSPSAS